MSTTTTAEPRDTAQPGRVLTLLRSNTLWTLAVLVALFLFFAVLRPAEFASTFNIRNVATDSAILLVLAVGMTFVIVTAGIDLSVGSILVFSGVIAAKTMVARPRAGGPSFSARWRVPAPASAGAW
jgi:ribose transport system permease protein